MLNSSMSKIILLVEEIENGRRKCANQIAHEKLGLDVNEACEEDDNFLSFNNKEYFEFHTTNTYDITSDTDVIYYVETKSTQDHLNPLWTYCISPRTIKKLQKYNIPIMINETQEFFMDYVSEGNHTRSSSLADFLDKKLINLGLINNNIIINGVANLGDSTPFIPLSNRKIFTNYSFYFFSRAKFFINQDITNKQLSTIQEHLNTDKDKIGLCINRQPRELRCVLLALLESYRKESIFTMLGEEPLHNKLSIGEVYEKFRSDVLLLKDEDLKEQGLKNIESLIKDFPEEFDIERNKDARKLHTIPNKEINKVRLRCMFELVTETHDSKYKELDASVITEKSLWPILNKIPFAIIGHQGNYRFLKKLGFNLYEKDLLSENDTNNTYEHNFRSCIELFHKFKYTDTSNWVEDHKDACELNFSIILNTNWGKVEADNLKLLLRRQSV